MKTKQTLQSGSKFSLAQHVTTFVPQLLCLLLLLLNFTSKGQNTGKLSVQVSTNAKDWLAKTNDKVDFQINIKDGDQPYLGDSVSYEIGPETTKPFIKTAIKHFNGQFKTEAYSLKKPGFLRCTVTVIKNGKEIKKFCTVGFEPEHITATQVMPKDFHVFWDKALLELKNTPLITEKTLWKEKSTAQTNVYRINFTNIGDNKIYGVLCVPTKAGHFPAVLRVPGAGVRPYNPDLELASKGLIVLTIGIHGIPVTLDSVVYQDLAKGALKNYPYFNMYDKDAFYYKRVYLGCVRANDVLTSLAAWDNKNLIVTGGSQGGALSIVTAALDKRVTALAAFYPALSDLTGYLHQRAGGWPHYFASSNYAKLTSVDLLKANLSYYDVVNFARQIMVPGFYSWGFNDLTCPPTSMYAAYNEIGAAKILRIYKETGHFTQEEQRNEMNSWIVGQAK